MHFRDYVQKVNLKRQLIFDDVDNGKEQMFASSREPQIYLVFSFMTDASGRVLNKRNVGMHISCPTLANKDAWPPYYKASRCREDGLVHVFPTDCASIPGSGSL